jgi:hypothetical protein
MADGTTPEQYFDAAAEAFETAAAHSSHRQMEIRAGREIIRLRFAGSGLFPVLTPALEHLLCDSFPPGALPALTICCFDTESTGVRMPPPAWSNNSYGRSGEVIGFNNARIHTLYMVGLDIFQMFDRERRQAIYWVRRAAVIPYWETSFAFRTILHWWTLDRPYQLMHAGAVGFAEGGVLIAGPSGSGKTTTTLSCLDSNLLYAGDDYLMVGVDASATSASADSPHAWSLYSTAKLLPDSLARLPALTRFVTNSDRLDVEKAMVFLYRSRPEKVVTGFPIRAILTPRVTGARDTRILPSTPLGSMRALLPTTVFHLPGGTQVTHQKIAALARQVPGYILEAGTDLSQIPAQIERFILEGNKS